MATEHTEIKKARELGGKTAYEIACRLLNNHGFGNVVEQIRCRLAEWLIEQNENDYRFADDRDITVPTKLGIVASESLAASRTGPKHNSYSPKGWMLTTSGNLVRGKTGWLVDENGLYILQDGRRLDEKYFKTEEGEKEEWLKIGNKEIWQGLDKILKPSENGIPSPAQEFKYSTLELFKIYGPSMDDVVYQAFQINICYNDTINAEKPYNIDNGNGVFYSIGRDETGIPIVVTRIGDEGATKKLVIAGPHGNERMARFVVLETQRHFIKEGLPATSDLALYFVPAMSPTLFFADARGLPFVEKDGNKYKLAKTPNDTERVKKVKKICGFLSIPKLHDFMGTKPKENKLVHELIQEQKVPEKPEYGIDTNRDFYNVLKSTVLFGDFITGLGSNPENLTVIMLHGYDSVDAERVNNHKNSRQGTVYGPYMVGEPKNNEIGWIDEAVKVKRPSIERCVNFMTVALFGYRFNKLVVQDPDLKNERQKKFFFLSETNVASNKGEWTRKLYGDRGERDILCFDIELGETYRDGTRGKDDIEATGRDKAYDVYRVVNRSNPTIRLPFFQEGDDKGKFVATPLRKDDTNDNRLQLKGETKIRDTTLTFHEFLKIYFQQRGEFKFPGEK